jgi:tetratricopeptide (TPR) repeat protein
MRAATGLLGKTSVLTTTRFPIAPLEHAQAEHFLRIDIDRLSDEAAIALARRRGVEGTDEDVRRLTEACGRHALLVDLTAGCLAEFGERAAELEPIDQALLDEIAPERRGVIELQRRFIRTAQRYRQLLEAKEPEAWALLRLACLFKNGVALEKLLTLRAMETTQVLLTLVVEEELAREFPIERMLLNPQPKDLNILEMGILLVATKRTEPTTAPTARMPFAARFSEGGELILDPISDPQSLRFAASMEKLVQRSRWHAGISLEQWVEAQIVNARRTVHDAFATLGRERAGTEAGSVALLSKLSLIDARSGRVLVHPAVREGLAGEAEHALGHRRAWSLLASSNLSGRPGRALPPPADWEELMHHMIGANQTALAWSFYRQQIGGFLHLGVRRAAYAHGDALMRLFGDGEALDPKERAPFFNEWGLYLHRLGRIDRACECFRRAAEIAVAIERPWLATVALQNLADSEILAGRAPQARTTILSAAGMLASGGDPPVKMRPEEFFARESRREVIPVLIEVGAASDRSTRGKVEHESIESLIGKQAWPEVERLCRLALIGARHMHGQTEESVHHAYLSLVLAETGRELGDPVRALGHRRLALEWALEHGERELLARARVEHARAALASRNEETCVDHLAEASRIADDSGYGTLRIEIALVRAELAMLRGRTVDARAELTSALEAAIDPTCGHARGAERARSLLARLNEPMPERRETRRSPARLVVAYAYQDSQWLEELVRELRALGIRERIDLWNDALEDPAFEARGRVVLLTRKELRFPAALEDAALIRAPLGHVSLATVAKQLATTLDCN